MLWKSIRKFDVTSSDGVKTMVEENNALLIEWNPRASRVKHDNEGPLSDNPDSSC